MMDKADFQSLVGCDVCGEESKDFFSGHCLSNYCFGPDVLDLADQPVGEIINLPPNVTEVRFVLVQNWSLCHEFNSSTAIPMFIDIGKGRGYETKGYGK